MATNKCSNCGQAIQDDQSQCPSCRTLLPLQQSHDDEGQTSVSGPIRKRRSLPYSCVVAVFLFLPTIILVTFLMHSHFRQEREHEEQERLSTEELVRAAQKDDTMLKKMRDMQNQSNLNLIMGMQGNGKILVIKVGSPWGSLVCSERLTLTKLWLKQWKSLGGEKIEVRNDETGTQVARIGSKNEIIIIDCE